MKIIKKLQEDGSFKEQTYYSVDEVAKMYSVTPIQQFVYGTQEVF